MVGLFVVKLIAVPHFPRLPPKCCITIAFDSLRTTVTPRRNWKEWFGKIWDGGGGGGVGENKVHYGLCERKIGRVEESIFQLTL